MLFTIDIVSKQLCKYLDADLELHHKQAKGDGVKEKLPKRN